MCFTFLSDLLSGVKLKMIYRQHCPQFIGKIFSFVFRETSAKSLQRFRRKMHSDGSRVSQAGAGGGGGGGDGG